MSIEVRPFRAKSGTILFRQGDHCAGYLRVLTGQIKVHLTAVSGREIVLYRVKPGDVCLQTFACLTSGQRYAAEGILEADLIAEVVPAAQFQAALADQDFRHEVHLGVARRFAEMENLLERMVFDTLDQRLAAALLAMADAAGEVHLTHEALAAECGSVREAVSRKLSVFAQDGLISLGRGQIIVKDSFSLRQRAALPM
jgi:CRP/FNR family transcriptional regulator, anaerobic regulatory protein